MRLRSWLLSLSSLWLAGLGAQSLAGIKNADAAFLFRLGYGAFSSAGDLGDRFGSGFAIDGGIDYLRSGSNWQFGVAVHYGFGNDVKQDVLAGLRTDAGSLIGNQLQPANVVLRQRQMFLGPRVGRTLYLGGKNQRAGLQLSLGVGYFYSRIRFQDDPLQFVPQIDRPRQAIYDRLAGGPALYPFIGYQQLALNRRINFYAGAEAIVGFTRELRAYDYSSAGPLPVRSRNDLVLGLRAGIILPVYRGKGEEIFY